MSDDSEKIDVAVNIFAKPYQTALSLLSLLDKSGRHIHELWLQYEPVGSKYDTVPPYAIAKYLAESGWICHISQPEKWLDLEAATPEMLQTCAGRACIRYEHAFENSASRLLFIMHNDIFVLKDILGDMKAGLGDAFAIGHLGQCWNCPAANPALMRDLFDMPPCTPEAYLETRLDYAQLCRLYDEAVARGVFVRPYYTENFRGEFEKRPWPLPECRINEWAMLLDLHKTRPLSVPRGSAWPPGAYRACGDYNLDIGTPFFRDIHAQGLHARHFNVTPYLKHWVGTGNNTPTKYMVSEERAKKLLVQYYPAYMVWLEKYQEKKA